MASASKLERPRDRLRLRPPRVLSIQSHVVSGYVGNKAAVFPLQLLGFDVDVCNSVHFSNHTGYPNGVAGERLNGRQLMELVEGLEGNGLLYEDDVGGGDCGKDENGVASASSRGGSCRIGHVLTGYIGSESFLRSVVDVVKKVRGGSHSGGEIGTRPRFFCDPVLGDMGRFYVPESLVQIYREEVLPLADAVTPNQFEVEQLTGIKIRTIEDTQRACRALHDMGPKLVVITSIPGTVVGRENADVDEKDVICTFASKRRTLPISNSHTDAEDGVGARRGDEEAEEEEQWIVRSPLLPGQFTGTGDVCAALLLGWTAIDEERGVSLGKTMEKVAGTMSALVKRTSEHAMDGSVFSRELKLIASRDDIIHPPATLEAERIS